MASVFPIYPTFQYNASEHLFGQWVDWEVTVTLEFDKLNEQVRALGSAQVARQANWQGRLAEAWENLHSWAGDSAGLNAKVDRALAVTGGAWPVARPGADRLDAAYPLPAYPAQGTIIAVDGSQIHPDPHGPLLYFLINVGSIILTRGSGQAPDTYVMPELHYTDEALYPDHRNLIRGARIDIQRELAELKRLADLTERQNPGPAVALLDGPLLMSTYREPDLPQEHERNLRQWLALLSRLRSNQAIPAGYTDRPRSARVLALLLLASIELEEICGERLDEIDLRGLIDSLLFHFLAPGERSALFSPETRVSAEYRQHGHEIWFFYLNVAPPGSPTPGLARVEVPEWVAQNPESLDCIHALLYEQCQVLGGYPYVLTRAHELATVTVEDKRSLEFMITQVLQAHNVRADISEKARHKAILAGGSQYFR